MKQTIETKILLGELFHDIHNLIDLLEPSSNKEPWPELELAFRLINAEKRDKRFERQLFHAIKRIEAKDKNVAEIVKRIEKSSLNYAEPINFNILLHYALYLKEQNKSTNIQDRKPFWNERIPEIIKRGNSINLAIDY